MWPTIGTLRTYIPIYLLALVVQGILLRTVGRREGVSRRITIALNVAFIFGMCVGSRILYDFLHTRFHWRDYLEIRYYFTDGLWGGPLAYLMVAVSGVVLFTRERKKLLDLIAVTLPVPMIVAKLACVFNGCCYGAPCELPWAITYLPGAEAPAGIARHATPVYEILVLMGILLVFHLLDKTRWRGRLLVWFVFMYGLGRPLTEVFRAPEEREPFLGSMSSSQLVCLAAALVSGVLLICLKPRRKALESFPPPGPPENVRPGIAAR